MNFLLIQPCDPVSNKKDIASPTTHPPLGLLYVAAALEQNGHKVEIIDFCIDNIPFEKLMVLVNKSDVVGFTINYINYKSANQLMTEIKKNDNDVSFITGGPLCTITQRKIPFFLPSSDIYVCGEGEQVIIDIANYYEGKKKLSSIPGIFYKENDNIKSGKPIEVIKDLDSVPFPARHLVEKYDYGLYPWGYQMKKKVTSMITSRGCPFHCRFCTRYNNIIKGWGYRQRSAQNVVNEIIEVNKNYRSMFIVDDNFLENKKRAEKIFDLLIEIDINLDLYIEGARVTSADKELYLKMKKARVKMLSFGIESGNKDVLDFYNKKINLNQIRKAIKLSRKMGITSFGSFILGAPIETKKHIENTIKFACSLPLDYADFTSLIYMVGSSLWIEAVKDKKISEHEVRVFADSSRGLGNFTIEELEKYRKLAVKRFFLRPSYILSQVIRGLKQNDADLILHGIDFLKFLN